MADKKDTQDDDSAEEAGKAKSAKTKLLLMVGGGVLVLLLSVVGMLFMLGVFGGGDDSAVAEEEAVEASEEEGGEAKAAKTPALYVTIQPPFVIGYQAAGRQRHLQVEIALQTRDQAVLTGIELHMPLIKSRLIQLLGGEVFEDLRTDEGKELMRQKVLTAVQETLQQEIGQPGVEQVLFTNLVMQ